MRMKELAFVLLRILALYVILKGISQWSGLLQAIAPLISERIFNFSDIGLFVLFSFLSGLLMVCIGAIVWTKSQKIAAHMISHTEADLEGSDFRTSEFYTIGITLAGIVVFVESLPALIGHIIQLIQWASSDYPPVFQQNIVQTWIALTVDLCKLLLAALLALKASGIYRIIQKLRGIGIGKE